LAILEVGRCFDTRRCQQLGRQGAFDGFDGVNAGRRLGVIVFWQAVDLLDIEDRAALEERDRVFGFLAGRAVGLGADDLVGIDDEAAMLALAHIGL
jgi:hypothetical protein